MKKNNRRNFVEANERLNVVICTECGCEVNESVLVRGEVVCMECVNDMLEEVKIIEEEKVVVEMKKVIRTEEDMRLDAEFNKEYELMLAKETKLNGYIRNAIIHGKTNKVDGVMNCITKGQLIAIARNYEVLVGKRMTQKQYEALKKLDGSQAHFVEMAIRQVQGKVREHNFNKRMAKANA